jgi:hypothetical protein
MRERITRDAEFYVMVDRKIARVEFPVPYLDQLFRGNFTEKLIPRTPLS